MKGRVRRWYWATAVIHGSRVSVRRAAGWRGRVPARVGIMRGRRPPLAFAMWRSPLEGGLGQSEVKRVSWGGMLRCRGKVRCRRSRWGGEAPCRKGLAIIEIGFISRFLKEGSHGLEFGFVDALSTARLLDCAG